MARNIFAGQADGGRIVQLEAQGLLTDIGLGHGNTTDPDDLQGPDVIWKSKPYFPLGEQGICVFRRIYFAIRHSGGFTITVIPSVDGVQLVDPNSSTVSLSYTATVPTEGTTTEVVELPISARGTSLKWELVTGAIAGSFHIEGAAIGYTPARTAKLDI